MDCYDRAYRFELLILETAEEENKRIAKEKTKLKAEHEVFKKEVEKKQRGICECGNEHPRWVHNDECYICAECFIHDLQCQAEVMVPIHRAEDLAGHDEYLSWDEHWEEENGIIS